MNQFVCALSGIKAQEDELEDIDFPDGWIEIRMTRRYVNPKWDAIQYVKAGLVQQYLSAVPEAQREEQILAITIQVEAQFAMIEAQTEQYIEDEVTKYIANPDHNAPLMAEYNKLMRMLGMQQGKVTPAPKPPNEPPNLSVAPEPEDEEQTEDVAEAKTE